MIPPRGNDDAVLSVVLATVTSDWYYDYDDDAGKIQYGIGTLGASEYARIRAELGRPIRFTASGVHVQEVLRSQERGIEATVIARDIVTGAEGIGHVFKSNFSGLGKDRQREEFNDRIAVSTAKRNAILDLVPESHISAILKARANIARDNDRKLAKLIKEQREAIRAAAPGAPVVEIDMTAQRPQKVLATDGIADPYEPTTPIDAAREKQLLGAAP
jgi:hypothetical protein